MVLESKEIKDETGDNRKCWVEKTPWLDAVEAL